ncbi:MAG: transcription-repair coupling factor [Pantoea sp. Brub]|nr:transcription-repair coupling factor [Pantoea sp. Brub]
MFKQHTYILPKKSGMIYQLGQLIGSSYAIECANIIKNYSGLVFIITSNVNTSLSLVDEISQFTSYPVMYLPNLENIPYNYISPNQNVIYSRLSTLYQLPLIKKGVLITQINTLMQFICPYDFLKKNSIVLKTKQQISTVNIINTLNQIGYQKVNQIVQCGEYNIQNNFFDIFINNNYYRIVFTDDNISNIHILNEYNKQILKKVEEIQLLPLHEFPIDTIAIDLFCQRWKTTFGITHKNNNIYKQINSGILPPGIEFWSPLFFKEPLSTLFDYLPNNTLIVSFNNIEISIVDFWQNVNNFYAKTSRLLLKPSMLWLKPDILKKKITSWPQLKITNEHLPPISGNFNLRYKKLPNIVLQQNDKLPLKNLSQFINKFKGRIIFLVFNEIHQEKLQKILTSINIYPIVIKNINDVTEHQYYIIIKKNKKGFIDTLNNIALICEPDLILDTYLDTLKQQDNTNHRMYPVIFDKIEDLHYGQLVVHIEHGIGRYVGLKNITTNGIVSEYLMILYANDDKLYVPISSLHLISNYISYYNKNISLHKLGSDIWLRSRQKVITKIRDIAVELLDSYANRSTKSGYHFKFNKKNYQQFCKNFPFDTTSDQEKAINLVLKDMCQPLMMDRLICGDVGFGKTEVAMRAAFIAVDNNKQVAVLVPNTLLAQQHYENFIARFQNWSFVIDMLSRFRTDKENSYLLERTKAGKIDILIGTHKLLNNNIKWKNLGLLIIDEEHRFGVYQKEIIKKLYNNIDILTLTATPIPRTLHMAINNIRDLSIITTPPSNRVDIKTFVCEFNDSVIREAILREIIRGGQVYYIHNDINSIKKIALYLSKLVPKANINIGHGQMRKNELAKVMNDFNNQKFNVLVCTTIIETGIDIPNVNTIIIERADRFGLAQLYQLRGRVGRSYQQAYAWFLTPNIKSMSKYAIKRLEVISSFKSLGSGFNLAINDLEIRGSGELLGEKQSGQIDTLGLSLYMKLLENTIHNLKNGKMLSLDALLTSEQIEIELQLPAILPEKLIPDISTRLFLYKRIAIAKKEEDIYEIKKDIINKFGFIPDETHNLLNIAILRLKSKILGVCKIKAINQGVYFDFLPKHNINLLSLIKLIQKDPNKWKLNKNNRLYYFHQIKEKKVIVEWICDFINNLINNSM